MYCYILFEAIKQGQNIVPCHLVTIFFLLNIVTFTIFFFYKDLQPRGPLFFIILHTVQIQIAKQVMHGALDLAGT